MKNILDNLSFKKINRDKLVYFIFKILLRIQPINIKSFSRTFKLNTCGSQINHTNIH